MKLSLSRAHLAVFPLQRRWICGGNSPRQSRRSVAELRPVLTSGSSDIPVQAASRDDDPGEPHALPLISSGREWTSFIIRLSEECVILFDDDATQRCLYPEIGHAASARLSFQEQSHNLAEWDFIYVRDLHVQSGIVPATKQSFSSGCFSLETHWDPGSEQYFCTPKLRLHGCQCKYVLPMRASSSVP